MNSRAILFVPAVAIFSISFAKAENWPQFRGAQGDGHANGSNLPVSWSESENIAWKTPIHGRGWSSPVVWGDQIWLTTATLDGKKMYAVCVDRSTGKTIHDLLVFENAEPRFCHPTNSYASPTPVVEEERVYVHFGSYGTACLDTATGGVIWQRRDLHCNHWRGPGSSPILHDGRLYVAFDGYDVQYVVALDKQSGETIWRNDRNIDYGTDDGDQKKAYSTCHIVKVGEQELLISPSAAATIAYDPKTGDEMWRVRHGGMNACSRPVFGHGLVFIVVGDSGPTLCAVKADGKGDITDSNIEWQMDRGGPKRPSLVLQSDHLFMVTDDGVALCLAAKSGEVVWKERLGGNFRASPILAGDRLYFFDLDGVCAVVEANADEFKLIAKNELDNGCQASPAVVGDQLYVRTTEHLYCITATQ